MSEEKNIENGESEKNIENGEPVPAQEESTKDASKEKTPGDDKEIVRKSELDKVPNWVKEEIIKEHGGDFDKRYSLKRDKERYEELLPKVVKENHLTAEEETKLAEEIETLCKYKDENGDQMSYEHALRLATRGLKSTTLKQAVKIAAGALPPMGETAKAGFNTTSIANFQKMNGAKRKEYMAKSIEEYGEVKYN